MFKLIKILEPAAALHMKPGISLYRTCRQFSVCKTTYKRRSDEDNNNNNEYFRSWKNKVKGFPFTFELLVAGGAVFSLVLMEAYVQKTLRRIDNQALTSVAVGTESYGEYLEGLPEYTMDEIAEHNTLEKKIWISFRHGVYDITDFVAEHPGGDKILLGAGGSAEPFWALYAVHKNPHVLEILEKYRIGNLCDSEVGSLVKDMEDPYANEPKRHSILKPSSKQPFNAEPPPTILADHLITPNEIFYVRNHLPVPHIDATSYELDIEGLGLKEKTLSLDNIKNFPKHTINATVQCGGNRRSEMAKVKPIKGLSWGQAAISNAEWTGAKLCDVLKSAGLDENNTKALHIQFEGFDTDPTGSPYGASIPIEKAMDPSCDVLLAYEMNGSPIPKDHGFPIRLVVPGVVGARSVKWLGRIIVSEEESEAHWQRNDYKSFAPNVDWNTVDFSKSPAIQEMPVNSAICEPAEGDQVEINDGKITAKGYAFSGGGRKIIRVDVSADGGKTWQAADELVADESKHPRSWSWTLWKANIPVSSNSEGVQLVVKAIDSNYNTQPESFENIWNLRGLLSNAYHKINVTPK